MTPSEALVGSPVAGDVVSPARVARYWAALALTFILAENARGGAGLLEQGLQKKKWCCSCRCGGWRHKFQLGLGHAILGGDRYGPPDSSTFLKIASMLVNSSPISAADIGRKKDLERSSSLKVLLVSVCEN